MLTALFKINIIVTY